jgi:hypothetical protein
VLLPLRKNVSVNSYPSDYFINIAKSAKKEKKSTSEKKKKEEADDGALKPTRPTPAFFFFAGEKTKDLKEKEKITHKEAQAKAGVLWNEMSEEAKKPFAKMHDDDVARYGFD